MSRLVSLRRHAGLATAAVAAACSLLPAAASAAPPPATGCAEVDVITVRGTGEPQGGGTTVGPLASSVQAASARTVSIEHLVYSASAVYPYSVPEGQTRLISRIRAQAAACPSQRFVLTGYSLGAWVTGNALAGNGLFTTGQRIPADVGARIAAIVLYGNPTFNSYEPFDAGSFTRGLNGSAGARPTGSLATYASRLRDYCNFQDPVCQVPGVNTAAHLDYNKYRSNATSFVIARTG